MTINRIDYTRINPAVINAMAAAKTHMTSIAPGLRALTELRVSQINGCAYCIELHGREALSAGETAARIDALRIWHQSDVFSESERAALAWAEAVTRLPNTGAPDDLYDDLRQHFSDQQVVDLTVIISQMNAWNRLAVSFRHEP